ncbi:undecaprenyl-diphosphate phosphatase [Candidatus Pacearchaeota archaeon]|nr:undecaprenyl-diphosphate phosphatase [Candidatus Pacearchaeota archaeon]
MNDLLAALILAVVQGITEWLPISSSGHLLLFEHLLGYSGGLLFEVALHFGTLMAVFVYFGKDIVDILRDVLRFRFDTQEGKTGVLLIVASIPAALIGYTFFNFFEGIFSSLLVAALGFAVTGAFLLIASLDFKKRKKMLSPFDALLVGVAQAASILPGISRSGSTLATGMLLGLEQKAAARFSFLMAIPIIFGANILVIGNQQLPSELIWATLVSFLVGLLVIHWMFKVILNSRKNLRWFAFYALSLAAGLLLYLSFSSA